MDTLQKAKIILDIGNDNEADKINLLISMARNEVIEFCNLESEDDITDALDDAVCQIAVHKYNRIGTEGLTGESYSGASYSYADNYPNEVMSVLYRHRRLRMV